MRLDLEHLCKLLNCVERDRVHLALESRDIGSIDAREIGELFLGQFAFRADAAKVRSKNLPQRHADEQTLASTLQPRSILYTKYRGGGVMSAMFIRLGASCGMILAVAACAPQASSDQNEDATNLVEAETIFSEGPPAGNGGQTDPAEFSEAESSINLSETADARAYVEEESSPESEVWVGMSGVPAGCTLTNYRSLEDVRVVMENDGGSVLEKTSNLIIVRKSAPNGQFKVVYTTNESLCEVVVTRPSFARFPPTAVTTESEPGR